MVDVRHQHFVIARFADYCAYTRPFPPGTLDPVQYLSDKLGELDEPLAQLKQGLLESHLKRFTARLSAGVTAEELTDFRALLEGYLAPADYFDAAFHLMDPAGLKDPGRLKLARECLAGLKAARLSEEESKPEERQGALYKRLTGELYKRLGLEQLEAVRRRKPLTVRRLMMILRRLRRETAEYATVFHFPLHPEDTFTPFIIPRIEALVAANRRFLRTLRTR